MATLTYWDESLLEAELMELEVQLYSKSQIANAGKLLASIIDASRMNDPDVREAFKIAWNWRNSHILPMRKLRAELSRKAKRELKCRGRRPPQAHAVDPPEARRQVTL